MSPKRGPHPTVDKRVVPVVVNVSKGVDPCLQPGAALAVRDGCTPVSWHCAPLLCCCVLLRSALSVSGPLRGIRFPRLCIFLSWTHQDSSNSHVVNLWVPSSSTLTRSNVCIGPGFIFGFFAVPSRDLRGVSVAECNEDEAFHSPPYRCKPQAGPMEGRARKELCELLRRRTELSSPSISVSFSFKEVRS